MASEETAPFPTLETQIPLLCEQRAEEWHCDSQVHASRVEAEKSKVQACKARQENARERKVMVMKETEERVEDVLSAAMKHEQESARLLSELRTELVDVKCRTDEVREDCDKQVAAIELQIQEERKKREALHKHLQDERQTCAQIRQRHADYEMQESIAMNEQEKRRVNLHAATNKRICQIRLATEAQEYEVRKNFEQELEAYKRQEQQVQKDRGQAIEEEVHKRQHLLKLVASSVGNVDNQVRACLQRMHQEKLDTRDASFSQIQEIQQKEFQKHKQHEEEVIAMLNCVACAAQDQQKASNEEVQNKYRAQQVVQAFGGKYPASQDYQVVRGRRKQVCLAGQ